MKTPLANLHVLKYRRPLPLHVPVITALRDMLLLAQSEYPRDQWEEHRIVFATLTYRQACADAGLQPDPNVE